MKKIVKMTLAALCAAVLTGSAVTAPVCAAGEKSPVGYVPGDINMNGRVAMDDCLIVMQAVGSALLDEPCSLSAEQLAIGNVWDIHLQNMHNIPLQVDLFDAFCIVQYYSAKYLFNNGEPVNWETVLGKDDIEKHFLTAERGDYTVEFSDEAGDYVIVKKG